jgi:large subunit ribosomal protein L30
MSDSKIKVTLVKSLAGRHEKHIATAAALGLRKIGDTTIQPDNEATQGKLTQIAYLVCVEKE